MKTFFKTFVLAAFAVFFVIFFNYKLGKIYEAKNINRLGTMAVPTKESARCLNCHAQRQPLLVERWASSKHAKEQVGCYECHKALKVDPSAKHGHYSYSVSMTVSPKVCASCHEPQYKEFSESAHAKAYETPFSSKIASNTVIYLASCAPCHGSEIEMRDGECLNRSWPNHGIGRINTDGSRGDCSACHEPHFDSLKEARSPETCAKCHSRDVASAYRAWKYSKHGTNHGEPENIFRGEGRYPKEQVFKPDCFTCHMASLQKDRESTHNISSRISWQRKNFKAYHPKDWGTKRLAMYANCVQCHSTAKPNNFFRNMDTAIVELNKLVEELEPENMTEKEQERIKGIMSKMMTGLGMQSPKDTSEAAEVLYAK